MSKREKERERKRKKGKAEREREKKGRGTLRKNISGNNLLRLCIVGIANN